jgi:hypothetical protein
MFYNLRLRWGAYKLAQKLKQQQPNRAIVGLTQAEYIGILFNVSEMRNEEIVKRLVKHLVKQGKRVKALGYVDLKKRLNIPMSTLRFDYFTSKEVDFGFMPNSMASQHFTEERFDLLIDLDLENDFPLQCISKLSQAKCKVGNVAISNHYDISIKVEEDNMTGMVEESLRYLEMIKK